MSAWASQSQKHRVVCRACQPLVRTLLGYRSQPSVHTSLLVSKLYRFCQCQGYSSTLWIPLLPVLLKMINNACAKAWCYKHWKAVTPYMLGETVLLQCSLQKFQSSKGLCSEQIQFSVKTGVLVFPLSSQTFENLSESNVH